MVKKKTIFVYPEYYDATTASNRVLNASKDLFEDLRFFYWAKTGFPRKIEEEIFSGIEKVAFTKIAKPRSFKVFLLFIEFQFWIIKNLLKVKPDLIVSFTFYTIFPSLLYKYFFKWNTRVIYDPRDYIAVSYLVNKVVVFCLRLLDNIAIKLSDFIIFPDFQYFRYYGLFKLSKDKYYILPNSTESIQYSLPKEDIYKKYNINSNCKIIPILGYFAETRGRKLFFEVIKMNLPNFHFIFAGDLRDPIDIAFFTSQPNVSYLGKIPYLEALFIIKNSSFTPLIYDPLSLNNKYAYPTKFYDSLMVGTPVLVSIGQIDIWEIIRNNNMGYGIPYNDTKAFVEILENLDNTIYKIDRELLKKYFRENFDFSSFKPGLRKVYSQYL